MRGDPIRLEEVQLRAFVAALLALIALCALGTCGDIEQPGGSDGTSEVGR